MRDHPEIARTLRTGYPFEEFSRYEAPECDKCGQEVDCDDPTYRRLYNWCGQWICADCLKDEIAELDASEIASLMGIKERTFSSEDFFQ